MTTKLNRFYVHNGPARASLAIQHDPSGCVLLATSFATTKRDANGRIDTYSKKNARTLLDARFEDYMSLAVAGKGFPPLMLTPGVFFVGIYDGDKTKNDIFGKLIDIFNDIGPKRNVEDTNAFLHAAAASLLVYANHHIANTDRKTLKKMEQEVGAKLQQLGEKLKVMLENSVRESLEAPLQNESEYDRIIREENEQYEKDLAAELGYPTD